MSVILFPQSSEISICPVSRSVNDGLALARSAAPITFRQMEIRLAVKNPSASFLNFCNSIVSNPTVGPPSSLESDSFVQFNPSQKIKIMLKRFYSKQNWRLCWFSRARIKLAGDLSSFDSVADLIEFLFSRSDRNDARGWRVFNLSWSGGR